MKKCQRCGSKNTEEYKYAGASVIKCDGCGFDEGNEFQQFADTKTSQKAKGNYSVYKSGGSRRTKK